MDITDCVDISLPFGITNLRNKTDIGHCDCVSNTVFTRTFFEQGFKSWKINKKNFIYTVDYCTVDLYHSTE